MGRLASHPLPYYQQPSRVSRRRRLALWLLYFYTLELFLDLKAREGFFLGACRHGICFVPMILLLPRLFGLPGIILAQPAADFLSAIITGILAYRLHRTLRNTL